MRHRILIAGFAMLAAIGRIAKGTYIARIRTASGIVSERIAIVAGK